MYHNFVDTPEGRDGAFKIFDGLPREDGSFARVHTVCSRASRA
jgi:hypothetical protein